MEWPQNSLLHSPCLEQFLEIAVFIQVVQAEYKAYVSK